LRKPSLGGPARTIFQGLDCSVRASGVKSGFSQVAQPLRSPESGAVAMLFLGSTSRARIQMLGELMRETIAAVD